MSRMIYDGSMDNLADSVIDLSSVAKPCHYRLIDCSRLVDRQSLRIYEFTDSITAIPYAAISYVWRGNPLDPDASDPDLGAFSVKGAEDGDPVGINALLHACTAALMEGASYLWLDRLCIMQTSKDDKAWQITRMYGVYMDCKVCLVLPGGIRRLVTEEEETTWIERGWTLQEVTAPKRSMVLFKWEHGSGSWEGYKGGIKGTVTEVIQKESAMMPLREMLAACEYPQALGWAGAKAHAIWQNSFWRTSSRPVDMVLSIMRIFGVTLNPRLFHKDDRIGATIALAKEILRRGGKPTWLVMAYDVPPSRFLSSFPEFPTTDVTGEISFLTASDKELFELTLWWVKDLPNGSMDDDGYVTITSKAAPVLNSGKTVKRKTFSSTQNNDLGTRKMYVRVADRKGRIWKILKRGHPLLCENHGAFIIFLGHAHDCPRPENSGTNAGPFQLPRLSPLRAIIVEKHANRKYHRSGAVTLGEVWEPLIEREWQEQTFAIGGPDPLPPGTFRGSAVIHIEKDTAHPPMASL